MRLPTLMISAITWAVIGGALWLFGVIAISLAWIVGPLAYIVHLNLLQEMVRKIVSEEMEKVVDAVEMEIDSDFVPVSFQDASHLEGSLN
ncbi:hypothetical protein HNR26_002327 [Rhizobium rosettiformans]|uniref:Uncharacterized protein n=2 Tax=Rhizobium rosettiformans TaxID=1368430 RepID=A0A4S8PYT2_9HYPH|nr:hypothetical protein [Rhizobium rosettiformans]MBB5276275.1 hypothetical protein [Rhizobium rosettiformans]THV36907.1 hypothetical protein FAA86_10455 [Rhizobium rosettiformans W3]